LRRLIIRPGATGDSILALPAMERLCAEFTEVWVASRNVPLIRFADRVRAISVTGLDLLGIPGVEPPAELLKTLASYDSIVSWYGTKRPEFRAVVAGLPFEFLPAMPAEGAGVHATDFYLGQTGGEGRAIPRIACKGVAGEYVVIHPFSGSARKNWPLARFCELARELPLPVRWCAGPEEALEDAVRIEDLYELACWLAGARLYIGNDSGITHLAAAAGAPVVALFGPTDSLIWAPRGERVHVVATARAGEPMENLSLQQVLAAVVEAGAAGVGG
jgi:ADP-heptose:LPS heptosyltransferase